MEWSNYTPLLIDYGTRVLGAIVFLIVTLIVAKWSRSLISRSMNRAEVDPTLTKFFSSVGRYLVLIIGVVAVLGMFGINVTSIAAILAAVGFAVGLALQGTLSNFAAGVMLLIFRYFTVGDKIEVAGEKGKVNEISLFTTKLDTPDNRRLIIPNSKIFGSTIENVNFHPIRRADVTVGTDYPADLDETRQILEDVVQEVQPEPLEGKEPEVYLESLGDSAVVWTCKVWGRTEDYWDVREELTRRIKQELDDAEIGIPYPQMDVHLDGKVDRASS